LTPPIIAQEAQRLVKAHGLSGQNSVQHLFVPGLVGMGLSFIAGLLALKLLSRWLEGGRWKLFGFYCLAAAGGVLLIHFKVKQVAPEDLTEANSGVRSPLPPPLPRQPRSRSNSSHSMKSTVQPARPTGAGRGNLNCMFPVFKILECRRISNGADLSPQTNTDRHRTP